MTLKSRTEFILDALEKSPLSARKLAEKIYIGSTNSDILTTGTICNILSAAGLVKRTTKLKGKRQFVFFERNDSETSY